jgi:hypothetical protein
MKRRVAWILVLIVEASFIAWGAMAALWPDQLIGPGGTPIAIAGYEGFSKSSWSDLMSTSPMTAKYITILFRTYGAYNVGFGVLGAVIAVTAFRRGDRWAWWALLCGNTITLLSAMRYDWIVDAIGPFEVSEYLGVVMLSGALALTAPFGAARRLIPGTV